MRAALGINLALLAATAIGGLLTDSLALLADAGHLLSDVGAIAIGLLAVRLARVAPTPERTFGLQRSEVLGALVNGLALVAIGVLIVVGAVARLADPPDVAAGGVVAVGLLGLAGNALAAWVLASGSRSDINLEGVLRHSAADALSSAGVVLAGGVILLTGWDRVDPIVSILIALLIVFGSWRLVKEPLDVLLESTPPGIDVREVGAAIVSEPGVVEAHDLHVWTVTPGFAALSAHLVVGRGADRDEIRARVEELLHERFGIHHTTLQVVEASGGELIGVEELRRSGGPGESR
jgi:cobalt-zinc-cadmium efflux system protein